MHCVIALAWPNYFVNCPISLRKFAQFFYSLQKQVEYRTSQRFLVEFLTWIQFPIESFIVRKISLCRKTRVHGKSLYWTRTEKCPSIITTIRPSMPFHGDALSTSLGKFLLISIPCNNRRISFLIFIKNSHTVKMVSHLLVLFSITRWRTIIYVFRMERIK